MLNPFIQEELVIRSKQVTLKKGIKDRRVERVNSLPHQAAEHLLRASSQSPFFQTYSLFSSKSHFLQAGLRHNIHQSVPHVQWSTQPPPVPHEICISRSLRKSCDVRDSSFSVLLLRRHSDTAAR